MILVCIAFVYLKKSNGPLFAFQICLHKVCVARGNQWFPLRRPMTALTSEKLKIFFGGDDNAWVELNEDLGSSNPLFRFLLLSDRVSSSSSSSSSSSEDEDVITIGSGGFDIDADGLMVAGLMLILLLWAVLMCFSRPSGQANLRLHLPQENFRNELVLVEFLLRATGSTRTLFAIGTWVPLLPRS